MRTVTGINISNESQARGLSSAVPRTAARKVELDFVRGIAILLVLGAHYTFPTTGLAPLDWIGTTANRIGSVGVDLFFTLSGFLVGGLLLKEYRDTGALNPRRFLVRRAFKIWPALYVLVLFHAVVGRHSLDSFFWQTIFHVQNFFGTSIKQTWSLAVEEHFYLVLAALLWFLVGKSPRTIALTLIAVCMLSIGARIVIVLSGDLDAAFRQTQYRIDGLLFGVLLAHISIFWPQVFKAMARQRAVLIAATIGLVAWIYLTAGNRVLVHSVGFTIQGIGFCLALVLCHEHSGAACRQRWYRFIAWVGVYSYGIYLWHSLALEPGRRLVSMLVAHSVPAVLVWVIAVVAQLAAGILTGYVMTKLVEWPFLRLRDAFFPAKSPSSQHPGFENSLLNSARS